MPLRPPVALGAARLGNSSGVRGRDKPLMQASAHLLNQCNTDGRECVENGCLSYAELSSNGLTVTIVVGVRREKHSIDRQMRGPKSWGLDPSSRPPP